MNVSPKFPQAYELLHKGTLALAHAEQAGFRVDLDYIRRKKTLIAKKVARYDEEFKATKLYRQWEHSLGHPPNINSDEQLAYFLYKIKKIPMPKATSTGRGSTDKESLKSLGIPDLNLLLEKDRYKKPLDVLTGLEREQVDGYVHPFFNLNLVKTFRSSSNSPNFQNVPKRDKEMMQLCRQALVPRPGHQFLEIDYSGVEVRISACYNKDKKLIYDIVHGDMHGDMAKELFIVPDFNKKTPEHYTLRQAAKNGFVFPEFYGDYYKNCARYMACNWGKLPAEGKWKPGTGIDMPEGKLSDHLIAKGIRNLEAFETHVQKIEKDFWENRYKVYNRWKIKHWETYKKTGYIDLYTGFRCSGVMPKNNVINYPVQGAAFHCLLWSFIELDKVRIRENWKTKLVGQIHDSILLDVHPSELERVAKVALQITTKNLPKAWPWIIVPLEVEMELGPVNGSWATKELFLLN